MTPITQIDRETLVKLLILHGAMPHQGWGASTPHFILLEETIVYVSMDGATRHCLFGRCTDRPGDWDKVPEELLRYAAHYIL